MIAVRSTTRAARPSRFARCGAPGLGALGRATALAAAVALASAACAPEAVWSGHSADRAHAIEIRARAHRQWVVVDGERRAAQDGIAAWSMATTADRLIYAARRGSEWRVISEPLRGGTRVIGPAFSGIGAIATSPTHLAYAAQRGLQWLVVVDGTAQPPVHAILADTLRFAGDSVVYAAEVDRVASGRDVRVFVGGVPQRAFAGIADLVTAGSHIAYAGRADDGWHVVRDGVVGATAYPQVPQLRISADGTALAWLSHAADDRIECAPWPTGANVAAANASTLDFADIATPTSATAATAATTATAATAARGVIVDFAARAGCRVAWVERRAATAATATMAGGLVVVAPDDSRATGDSRAIGDAPDAAHEAAARREFGPFSHVDALISDARGKRLGFAAERGPQHVVVIDGDERPGDGTPVFSGDGKRVAYLRRDGAKTAVVVDGQAHAFDLAIDGTFAFSRDGRAWAVIAGELKTEKLYVAVDGSARVPLTETELVSAAAANDPAALQRWAEAEATRAARR